MTKGARSYLVLRRGGNQGHRPETTVHLIPRLPETLRELLRAAFVEPWEVYLWHPEYAASARVVGLSAEKVTVRLSPREGVSWPLHQVHVPLEEVHGWRGRLPED